MIGMFAAIYLILMKLSIYSVSLVHAKDHCAQTIIIPTYWLNIALLLSMTPHFLFLYVQLYFDQRGSFLQK